MLAMYTRFPNLLSTEVNEDQLKSSSQELFDLLGSDDAVIRAWASILSIYTGHLDRVSFLSDNGAVQVNISDGRISKLRKDNDEETPRDATRVSFSRVEEPTTLAVEIRLNSQTRCGKIHSNGRVPMQHLCQLAKLLTIATRQVSHGGSPSSISYDETLEVSVLNEKPQLLSGPELLHRLVDSHSSGQEIAIDYYDGKFSRTSISYDTLHTHVANLEKILQESLPKRVAGSRTVIPLLIPQSPELYIAMLAVLNMGFAFCPLQLDAPKERLHFILKDVQASIVLTTGSLVAKLDGIPDIKSLDVGQSLSRGQEIGGKNGSMSTISPDSTAYIMYTSGSTGQPKGVLVSHRAATQSLLAHERHVPKFSRFLQFAAPTFDVSIFEIFFTLYRCSTLVVCERTRLLNDLPFAMRQMEVDAAEFTPTVAGGLLRERANAPTLRLLLTIGEMLTPKVVAEFGGDETKPSILWGMYGPTEAAIHCTLQPAFSTSHRPGNIGVPLDTVSTFIVSAVGDGSAKDEIAQILPKGFVGELAVGGFQLADGYLNRDEQTAKAFVRTKEHGIMYRTGDKARILLDGKVECLGRITSSQVKLRGQRVELGEVRFAAAKTAGCLDAVASVVEDILVVFCLTHEDIRPEHILTSCRSWLPAFMIPSDVVLLDEFPRLPSGKVDNRALEHKYISAKRTHVALDHRSGDTRAHLACDILQSVLGREVKVNHRLDLLGIDSLLAIRIASKLRSTGFKLSMTDLLSEKTVGELAQRWQSRELVKESPGRDDTQHPMFFTVQELARTNSSTKHHKDVEQVVPCTPLQLAMLTETMKDIHAYCNWIELDLGSKLTFQQALDMFQRLAAAHSILRSGFCALDDASMPYACLIYTSLAVTQFTKVDRFQRTFSLNECMLLRPLHIQIMCTDDRASALLQIHHALYDGWSVDLLVRDLHRLSEGIPPVKSPEFALVSDFYLKVDHTKALDYWQDHLSGFVPIDMPNFNGSVIESRIIAEEGLELTTDLSKLQRAAAELHVGTPVFFQAAVAYILSLYLGSTDVILGTVTSGRSILVPGIEDVVGPCLATCPLRVDISTSTTVADLLRHVHRLNHQLREHGVVSPQIIKQICDFEPSQSLWDVLFVWQESLESHFAERRNVRVVATADRLECALTLEFEPRYGRIFSKATFNTQRLSQLQVALMLQQINALVMAFVASWDSKLENVCSTMPMEVLSMSNPSPDHLEFEHGLGHAVEKYAVSHPDKLAVIFATEISDEQSCIESLTYKQLNDRANQLAHFLRSKDLKSSELIAICMEKSLELYVAILAVVKLGLGYLPITPATPLRRIKTMIDEACISLCLSQRSSWSFLELESICELLNVDTATMFKYPTGNLEIRYDGSRAAYAIFTSGSTGVPKGVLVTQQNLRSNLAVLAELYPIANNDRLLQSCSQAFDVSVFEIFFAWQEGMCLCSATNDVLFKDIEMTTRALEITHLSLTPTVAALIHPDNVPRVRFLVTAGEAVTQKVKMAWSDRGLFQGYGPSETTNICTVKSDVRHEDTINNIGPPFRNTSAFVFHPFVDVVLPTGAVGELCFGGDQVYRGYLNQPELTAGKTINHREYGRLYRSGDSGRILPDGSISFAARLDDQIKVRGQRVELNEINQCILRLTDIVDCATVVVERNTSQSALISFVVPKGAGRCSLKNPSKLLLPMEERSFDLSNAIMANLQSTLPTYMVPVAILPIVQIPMTVQGKIDRNQLSIEVNHLSAESFARFSSNDDGQDHDENDWTSIERAILRALLETLTNASITVRRATSFFSLGMDSISGIAFARRLSRILHRDVPLSAALRNPSVARLSQWLTTSLVSHSTGQAIVKSLLPARLIEQAHHAAIGAGVEVTNVLPCTPLQEAMLSSSSEHPDMYRNTIRFQIEGNLDRLKHCWKQLFSRHDILRTTFITTGDSIYPFVQMVLARSDFPWLDSSTQSTDKELSDPLPVVDSFKPAIHLRIIQSGSAIYLQFSCHHALYDGAAIAILLRELEDLYHGRSLYPVVSSNSFLQEMVAHRDINHLKFWNEHLQDLQPSILRTSSWKQELVTQTVSHSLSSLESYCHGLSVSLLSLCQTAWAKTLSSLFGTSDICFGNVFSGRSVVPDHMERLVAPTFNTVPFRIDLHQQHSNLATMKATQRINAACLNHQLTPLRLIQSNLGFAETGIFSSILLLQHSNLELDPSIWKLKHEKGAMNSPLIIEVTPNRREDTLLIILYYNTSVLHEIEAQEVLSHYIQAVDMCIEHPDLAARSCSKMSVELLGSLSKKITRPRASKLSSLPEEQMQELSPVQLRIFAAIAELTSMESSTIPLQASIHQLGIDSISAIQLAARLRAKASSAITAADVLQHPIIADLARFVEKSQETRTEQAAFDLQAFSDAHRLNVCEHNCLLPSSVAHVWPCTPMQMGLVSQFLRNGSVYANHVTYAVPGRMSPNEVFQAWEPLVTDFEILRTGFVALDENPRFPYAMVTYHPGSLKIPLKFVTMDAFDVETWRDESASRFRENIIDPPWAVCLQNTGGALLMHLSIFHGIYDATSLTIMMDALLCHLRKQAVTAPVSIMPVVAEIIGLTGGLELDNDIHVTYWQNTLREATFNLFPSLTPLRVLQPKTSVVTKTLGISSVDLERRCQSLGCSVQAVAQAVWARILSAYLGEDSVCFGVVLSGRDTAPSADQAVFPCLVTVPYGVTMVGKTNSALIQDAMVFNSSVRKHQFCSIGNIQRWTSRDVLFDTILAYQKTSNASREPGLPVLEEISTDEFSLSLELEPRSSSEMLIRATFKDNMLPISQASLLLEQYEAVLNDVLNRPDSHISDAGRIRNELLSITPAEEPTLESPVELLHEFVEHQAKSQPDKTAFEFLHRDKHGHLVCANWNYEQLNTEGDKIASFLRHRDIEAGSYVGICFEKCPEASFAMLGILKAGCAYVALDPSAPPARKSFIAQDSNIAMLLTSSQQSRSLEDVITSAPIVYVNEISAEQSRPGSGRPHVPTLPPHSVCYCLYTSGTTGTPKGCEITHHNAVQAMRAFSKLFQGRWDANSRWLQFASFHFDVSVLEQYWTWSEGLCVVSAPRDLIFEDLEATIQGMGITHIDLTPSLAALVKPANVPSLCKGIFITGGEQLKQEILDVWGEQEVIHNGYGPTETTIGVTMYTRVPKNGKPANIGKQFANVGTYVLQPGMMTPVLRGAIGELCIAGNLVGKGYLNRRDLTAEKFPYVAEYGERIYRTGDLVRICHDQSFLFIGRVDDQVKLRGQRLEIGEINSTIRKAVPAIADVATFVLRHPKQQRDQLVTFFTSSVTPNHEDPIILDASSGNRAALGKARDSCTEQLPGYMVPTFFIPVTRMPLSTNNKTDAKILKQLYCEASIEELQNLVVVDESFLSNSEKIVAEVLSIYCQVPIEHIRPTSNILELGLDSISVLGFCSKLKKAGFRTATAGLVLSKPTIRNLTAALANGSEVTGRSALIDVTRRNIAVFDRKYRSQAARALSLKQDNIEAILPCTPLQEGMILGALDRESYFSTFNFTLKSIIDIKQLGRAFQRVCSGLEILREQFLQTRDGYAQVILRAHHLPFAVREVAGSQAIDQAVHQARVAWISANNLHFPRPAEVIIWQTGKTNVMTLNIFHALYDGNCLDKILLAVLDTYNDTGRLDFGPPFHDALCHGPLLTRADAKLFWTSCIESLPWEINVSGQARHVVRSLQLADLFDTCRRSLNVTHQAVAQAAWLATLAEVHKTDYATTGVIFSGRSIDFAGAEEVIGPLFNTVPFQTHISASETWAALIHRCHDFNVKVLEFQHTALRDIQKWCGAGTTKKLFDSLFVFQMEQSISGRGFDNEIWRLQDDNNSSEFPLALEVEYKVDGSLCIHLASSGQLVGGERLEKVLDRVQVCFETAIRSPNTLVVDAGEFSMSPHGAVQDLDNAHTHINSDAACGFAWPVNAVALRSEISYLSGVAEDEITENASIFEFGLDSIDAIKLSSRLAERGWKLPVSTIMRNATIARMVDVLQHHAAAPERAEAHLPELERKLITHLQDHGVLTSNMEKVLPATPLQEVMITEMIESKYERYFNHDVLRLGPDVDEKRLHMAWQRVFERAPILRTSFYPIDDPLIQHAYAQVVSSDNTFSWNIVTVQTFEELSDVISKIRFHAEGSDFTTSLFRLTMVHSPDQKYLILSMPHALYDGYSLDLLHHDVREAYHHGSVSQRPTWDTVCHEIIATVKSIDARTFWSDFLSNTTSCLMAGSQPTTTGKHLVHRKEMQTTVASSDLRSFCKQQGITPQTFGQSCFALVLASYTRRLDPVFGVVLAGRDTEDAQRIMFPTINTVAFTVSIHYSKSGFLHTSQEAMASIRPHQYFPLRQAQRFANTRGQKLFDSLFIYQSGSERPSESQSLYESVDSAAELELPVCVEMEMIGGRLIWRVACHSEVFDEAGTTQLLNRLLQTTTYLMHDVEAQVVAIRESIATIGDLPSFNIEDSQDVAATNGYQDTEVQILDTDLSSTAKEIRSVLAHVAQIPLETIKSETNLYHIGLDSISAIKVCSLLKKRGLVITVTNLLRASTLQGIASLVDKSKANIGIENTARTDSVLAQARTTFKERQMMHKNISQDLFESILPATAGQIYMLKLWERSRGRLFFDTFYLAVRSLNISPTTIRHAVLTWVRARPILRTVFISSSNASMPLLQLVLDVGQVDVRSSRLPFSEKRKGVADQNDDVYVRSNFGMEYEIDHLLPSVSFQKQDNDTWKLGVRIHHALYDGVSLPLLLADLERLVLNPKATLATESISGYSMHTALSYSSGDSVEASEFWLKYLGPCNTVTPLSFTSTSDVHCQRFSIYMPGYVPHAQRLLEMARQNEVSLPALFLAIYGRSFSVMKSKAAAEGGTGSSRPSEAVVGVYIANRGHQLMGLDRYPTVNLLPLVVNTSLTLWESAAAIKDDLITLSEMPKVAIGLWQIEEWKGLRVDTFVNWIQLPDQADNDTGEAKDTFRTQEAMNKEIYDEVEGFDVPESMKTDHLSKAYMPAVDVEVALRGGSLDLGIFGPTALLEPKMASELLEDIRKELCHLVGEPDTG